MNAMHLLPLRKSEFDAKNIFVQKIRKLLPYNDAIKGFTPCFLLYLTHLTKTTSINFHH